MPYRPSDTSRDTISGSMSHTHYESKMQELRVGALRSHGEAPTALREQVEELSAHLSGRPASSNACDSNSIPPGIRKLIEKIALNAYKVTDEDVEHLLHEGYSEDAAFELIVCAAVGAGDGRFERAMQALAETHTEETDAT